MIQFSYSIPAAEDKTKVFVPVLSGGSAATSTSGPEGSMQAGYATVTSQEGTRDAVLRAMSARTLGSATLNVTYSRP